MQPSVDDIRYDLAITRARMAATLEEIDSRLDDGKSQVREKVEAVKERLDLRTIAEQHPWAVLAVAVAVGVAIGSSGADRRAAEAVGDAARALPDAARAAGGAVVARVQDLGGGGEEPVTFPEPATADQGPGLLGRLTDTLVDVFKVDQFVAEMAEASRSFNRNLG